jgi:hypothetical protein
VIGYRYLLVSIAVLQYTYCSILVYKCVLNLVLPVLQCCSSTAVLLLYLQYCSTAVYIPSNLKETPEKITRKWCYLTAVAKFSSRHTAHSSSNTAAQQHGLLRGAACRGARNGRLQPRQACAPESSRRARARPAHTARVSGRAQHSHTPTRLHNYTPTRPHNLGRSGVVALSQTLPLCFSGGGCSPFGALSCLDQFIPRGRIICTAS